MLEHLSACALAMALPGQPGPLYRAVDIALRALVGHRLLTMMVVAPPGDRVRRVYSTDPQAYPVGGYKVKTDTPWGKVVIEGKRHYIGSNAADIRRAFSDHELIASLGLQSVLNMPVLWDDRCIGTVNLLDAAEHFRPEHAALVKPYAQQLAVAFLAETGP